MSVPLKAYVESRKTIPVMQPWADIGDGWWAWVAPLDIDGVGVAGLRLRVKALISEPNAAITIQLEYVPTGQGGALDRIDWKPVHRHDNKGKGPIELRFKVQDGSHHHSFALNVADNGMTMRKGNLLIAKPIDPDPVNFDELLDFASRELNVVGLDRALPPDWGERLL